MPLPGLPESAVREWALRNPGHRDFQEAIEFLNRTGRFADIDFSEAGREQVFPAPEPPEAEQTHTRLGFRDGA